MFEIQGRVVEILPKQQGEGKNGTWASQEFVIETTDAQYPKKLLMKGGKNTVEHIGKLQSNDFVSVNFSIESREYNGRYFTNLNAFKVSKV